jgi:hypothetical protein
MDPAEEVLLDPVLVNLFFTRGQRKLFLCHCTVLNLRAALCRALASGMWKNVMSAWQALTRRMRELDKERLAKCEQGGHHTGRSPE